MTARLGGRVGMVILSLAAWISAQAAPPSSRPMNIVWIVADDLGYGDLGCYGARDIATPSVDGLAREGLRSTRFYAMPVCSPTRAALLTSRSPQAVGVESALMGNGGLKAKATTCAAWFKRKGYHTALVGKWHLGYEGDALPNKHGFDEFFGHLGGKIHYYRHSDELNGQERPDLWENHRRVERPGQYSTTMFADRACEIVRDRRNEPFFLMLSFNAPHYARGLKSGMQKPAEECFQAPPEFIKRAARNPDAPTMREMYAATVMCMDAEIGRVLDAIDSAGIRERTIVVFLSDNGADRGHGGSSGALSGHKAQLAEGGIRAPLIVRVPNVVPPGQVITAPADVRDLWPSCASLAGIRGDTPRLEGSDVSAAWMGKDVPERDLCFEWNGDKAVVRGAWKLVDDRDGAHLYNVDEDPAEKSNVAGQHQDRIAAMTASWNTWWKMIQEK